MNTITLGSLYNTFPQESKDFFDSFFSRNAKEFHDFLGLSENCLKDSILVTGPDGQINKSITNMSFSSQTRTFDGRVHGGAIAAVFDAVMGIPIGFGTFLPDKQILITKELMSVEIFKPIPVNTEVVIEVVCDTSEDNRKFWLSSNVKIDNEIVATAKGFFLKINI